MFKLFILVVLGVKRSAVVISECVLVDR